MHVHFYISLTGGLSDPFFFYCENFFQKVREKMITTS